jgi:hypothetical protein
VTRRVSIRASVYRGVNGFTVNAGRGRNVFCETRAQAEAYRALEQDETLSAEARIQRSYEILCGGTGGEA